nr:IS66 family transposase [Burkholderia thailandensis]
MGRPRRDAFTTTGRCITPSCDDRTKLHADDTPVPVLEPGNGKTKTGLWVYVRDDDRQPI